MNVMVFLYKCVLLWGMADRNGWGLNCSGPRTGVANLWHTWCSRLFVTVESSKRFATLPESIPDWRVLWGSWDSLVSEDMKGQQQEDCELALMAFAILWIKSETLTLSPKACTTCNSSPDTLFLPLHGTSLAQLFLICHVFIYPRTFVPAIDSTWNLVWAITSYSKFYRYTCLVDMSLMEYKDK